MIGHTEQEAAKVLCPQMLAVPSPSIAGGTVARPPFYSCRGSRCMAWRWANQPYEYCTMDNRTPDQTRSPGWMTHTDAAPPPPTGDGWEPVDEPRQKSGYVTGVLEQVWRRPAAHRRGFCGLAIQPVH